ncbi:MAG: UvrD-helicase domain-containing protein [Candidatus Binatia bacterium]
MLVIAGAGSGKTRTLVFRVARLVEQGVDLHAILLLTFTSQGSRDAQRAAGPSTAAANRSPAAPSTRSPTSTLRRHGAALGLASHFTILDRGDSEDAIGSSPRPRQEGQALPAQAADR